ncbi:MAG: SWIM zinc finger family protein [Kibdelosporangium sp.]
MDVDAVLALAPDKQVASSAARLAAPGNWSALGHDEHVLWGLCKGSGKKPYQVCVDLDDRATKCSCPSRKFPCKHAVAVQVLHVRGGTPVAEPPEWVGEWQLRREVRKTPKPLDDSPEAVERRAVQREKTAEARDLAVQGGVAGLREWLADVARRGIAELTGRDRAWWESIIRRMVDAQAPGLANSLEDLAAVVFSGGVNWAEKAADRIGGLHLLATLAAKPPPDLAEVVRMRLGYTTTEQETLAQPAWTDRWVVLLRKDEDDGRVRTTMQWVWGRERREWVTVIRHAAGGAIAGPALPHGEFNGDLHPYPAGAPRRMAVGEREPSVKAQPIELSATWTDALAGLEPLLRKDPWQRLHPLTCREIRLAEGLVAVDSDGRALPVIDDVAADRALAIHGGRPFDAVGLWDGWSVRIGAVAVPGGVPEVIS